jgi:hypothetical protein
VCVFLRKTHYLFETLAQCSITVGFNSGQQEIRAFIYAWYSKRLSIQSAHKKTKINFLTVHLSSSSSSDFFGLEIIACSDVHWSAHLLVGLPGSLWPRGL